jgi:molybdopterin-guanine dinucleotide biosynthesis protein A
MGHPKPLLTLAGETVLERQVRLLRSICRSVAVIGLSDGLPSIDVPLIPDVIRGRGPLGGIFTGLLRTRTEFNLFLGCDLPFVTARFLDFLARRALQCGAIATAPEMPTGGVQPLCAVYRRAALPRVRANLEAGQDKAQALVRRLRSAVIPWREIARAGYSPRIFANINTPEDYEAAKRILNGEPPAEGRSQVSRHSISR